MRRIASVLVGAALAISGAWVLTDEYGDGQGVRLIHGAAVEGENVAQAVLSGPPGQAESAGDAAGGVTSPRSAGFLRALAANTDNWEDIYQRGVRSGAAPEERFVALRVLQTCLLPLSKFPYPEILGAGEEQNQLMRVARDTIMARCAGIERVGLDRLRRDFASLKAQLETPASPLWQGHVGFGPADSPKRVDAATHRLRAVFLQYGAGALYWVGPEFDHYLEISSGALAQRVRTLDPDGRLQSAAIVMAMCRATGVCGQGGLPYLSMCAEAGQCDGADLGVTSHLNEVDVQHARTLAGWMIEAIESDSWR